MDDLGFAYKCGEQAGDLCPWFVDPHTGDGSLLTVRAVASALCPGACPQGPTDLRQLGVWFGQRALVGMSCAVG